MTASDDRAVTPFARWRNVVWALVALGGAVAFFDYFFRFSSSLPWTQGIGDWMDPYFVNVVMENWYSSALGLAGPMTPPMYFPDEAARYSHGFVLYGPVYSAFRLFTHPFVANTLTLWAVMVGGSWCLYFLLRRLGLRAIESIVVTAAFCTSPNIINATTVVWAQRVSVFLIPPILLVLHVAIHTPANRRRTRLALGGFAGLLTGLFLSQDFYTAALTGLMAGLLGLSLALTERRASVTWIRKYTTPILALAARVLPARRPSRWWLGIAAVFGIAALAIAIVPLDRFWVSGLGFSARDPARPWRLTQLALVCYGGLWGVQFVRLLVGDAPGRVARARGLLRDFCRPERRWSPFAIAAGGTLGVLVFLWMYLGPYLEFGGFPRQMIFEVLYQPETIRSWHAFESTRPFLIIVGIVVMMWMCSWVVDSQLRRHGAWFVLVSGLVVLMPLRFGRWSPWMSFFSWLPGMSSVRDPRRIIYLYELAVALVVATWLARLSRRSLVRAAAVLLVAGITYQDWLVLRVPYGRDIQVFDRWVRAPIQIDPSCRSFFFKAASTSYTSRWGDMGALYGIDAGFIALEHSIPPLNGYSAWPPRGWDLANPHHPTYSQSVDRWIRMHAIEHTCELDIDARTMTPYLPGNPRR